MNLDNKEVPGEMAATKMDYEPRDAKISQARWGASMRGVPFWPATVLCTRAAFGVAAFAAIAFTVSAALAKASAQSGIQSTDEAAAQRLN